MPALLFKLITLILSALPILKKLGGFNRILQKSMPILKLLLKNWKALLILTTGLVSGFLAGYWIKSPQIEVQTKVETVTEFIAVEKVVEVMPLLNCPYSLLKKPVTNGELLIEYKKLVDWRANCLNSIRRN